MTPIKLLIVSPCQGAYGGIEAFVLAVAALYFPCRWFVGVKKRSRHPLLRYI